ncbi:MAG: hypothetical protein KBT72_04720 [Zhongshania sp.]|jgi:hypothetical protein|uniref:Uncharacterized protein n=1 Tax=Zhongshania guokunii TaxID=641783 RepID=A0ABV3U411_9GAMM|nr:hypothetical protein [Zhongshania sp.]
MFEELKNWEMLSQVWFVHDYVQLIFHDGHKINICNPFSVESDGKVYRQRQPEYADKLVSLIGSRIAKAEYLEQSFFRLVFDCGSIFEVDLTKDASPYPEAFELSLSTGHVIEFNA